MAQKLEQKENGSSSKEIKEFLVSKFLNQKNKNLNIFNLGSNIKQLE